MKRRLKDAAGRWLPPVWMRLMRLVGHGPGQACAWQSSGSHRVLVVAPHPDDELAGCGGTLLRHLAAGDRVSVAVVTDGRRSRAVADPDRMAAERRREATAAAARSGVQLAWWGLPEGNWTMADLEARLQETLEVLEPDLLYVPSRIDYHPEHRRVAHGCARVLAATRLALRVRVYEVQVPLGALANLVCEVSTVAAQCRNALDAYASQRPALQWMERRWAYTAHRHGYRGQAEAFLELERTAYVELHREAADTWTDVFRGLRAHALSDPLAYWVGGTERRRLGAVAARHAASSG